MRVSTHRLYTREEAVRTSTSRPVASYRTMAGEVVLYVAVAPDKA